MSETKSGRIHAITRNSNVLNWLAWLLPLSLAGGSDLLSFEWLGATWYAFRIVVLIGAALACIDFFSSRRSLPLWLWCWIITCTIWLCWALFNRNDTMDNALWQKGIFYLLIGIASLLTIYHLSSHDKNGRMISAASLGLATNIIISAIQMITSLRPDSAFTHDLAVYSSEHYVRFVPTGLFGNPNHFAMYVCVQLLLLYTFRKHIAFTSRMVLYALSALLVLLTHSRIGEIALLLLCLLMVIENRSWIGIQCSRFTAKIIISILFIIAIIASNTWINTRNVALEIERNNGIVKQVKTASAGSRTELMKCGFQMISESDYCGVGPGQFQNVMQEKGWNAQTGGMVDPHCGIIEITAESGVLVALLWFVSICIFVAQSFKKKYALQSITWLLLMGVLQFANSTFVSTPLAWCLLAWPLLMYFEQENS